MSSRSTDSIAAGFARARVSFRCVSLITELRLKGLTRRVNKDLTRDAFWYADVPQSIGWP